MSSMRTMTMRGCGLALSLLVGAANALALQYEVVPNLFGAESNPTDPVALE
jgi:hypothetical protein